MEYTQNYQLPLWDKEDAVLRADFNENNQKIDAALVALASQMYLGSWVGDGTANRIIQLPFAPRFLLVLGHQHGSNLQATIVLYTQDCAYRITSSGAGFASQTAGGSLAGDQLQIGSSASFNNCSGETVHYIALK